MQAASITIRKERGKVVVQALGKTPKGKPYIKGKKILNVKSIASKDFKAEMKAAVAELIDSD